MAAHRIANFMRQHFVIVRVTLPVPDCRIGSIAGNAELGFI
jgi:hypothetical protein